MMNKRYTYVINVTLMVIFSIFSSDIPLDFHQLIRVVSLKYSIYFLIDINTK